MDSQVASASWSTQRLAKSKSHRFRQIDGPFVAPPMLALMTVEPDARISMAKCLILLGPLVAL